MKWHLGDELDNRIKQYDGWLDLIDIEAPDEQGVFVFVSDGLDVRYVGSAKESLDKEINAAVNDGKSGGASMYSWYVTLSYKDAESLSGSWIEKYRPANCEG